MSHKRTAPAGSGVISSREGSPALTVTDQSRTPASSYSRRRTKTPLPTVGLKPSTAYGTNNTVQPLKATGPQVNTHISNVLHSIIQTQDNNPKLSSQNRSPSKSPSIKSQGSSRAISNRSFEIESKIFRGADIGSSLSDAGEKRPKLKDPEIRSTNSPDHKFHQGHKLGTHMSTRVESNGNDQSGDGYNKIPTRSSVENPHFHCKSRPFAVLWRNICRILYYPRYWLISCKKILLVGVVLLLLFSMSRSASTKMLLVSRYLPETLSRLPIDENNITKRRLNKIESDVYLIQKKINGIDFRAVKKLEDILPNAVVLKNTNGKLQIPEDFWQAICDKILLDDVSGHSHDVKSSQHDNRNYGSNNSRYRRIWYQFINENEDKIGLLSDRNLTSRFPRILHENGIVSKAEIIDMIRENWEENISLIQYELKNLAAELKRLSRNNEVRLHPMYSSKLGTLGPAFTENLANAQLRAAAKVNIQNGIIFNRMRTNHFSKWTGALIDKSSTSPDYIFPSQANINSFGKIVYKLAKNPVPTPKPPEEALSKWEEQGDCWCSAQKGNGFGPSLGIVLGNKIYPEEIIVEHVPSGLALQPGAAPRNLELFAKIDNPEIEPIILQESRRIFPGLSSDPIEGLEGHVRIAAWIYELNAPSNIQTHEIPLKLKAFGVDTDQVVVRSLTNWGGGNVHYTCLYRLRLFGPISQPHPDL